MNRLFISESQIYAFYMREETFYTDNFKSTYFHVSVTADTLIFNQFVK